MSKPIQSSKSKEQVQTEVMKFDDGEVILTFDEWGYIYSVIVNTVKVKAIVIRNYRDISIIVWNERTKIEAHDNVPSDESLIWFADYVEEYSTLTNATTVIEDIIKYIKDLL
jgi:hypothetical protein